ncbi:RnfH family protein [Ferrimonas balearica]|uniref:RnfH family protein n=1 Tax=Ferrimonas balearica TaxID=44012 RepID=UPI001C9A14ED|nr:RnfH family protein [Ferrimonas balearica]MBY5992666.1 RnfH family protein [Ferrimonas balearica]
MAEAMTVEVVYALPEEVFLRKLTLPTGTTAEEAIRASGVLERYPEIDLGAQKIGIFSRTVKLGQVLSDGERVEIYRPLLADPREVRKRRAEKAKAEGRADKVTGGKPNPLRNKAE